MTAVDSPPRRRIVATIKVGADDMLELDRALNQIATDIAVGARNSVSGGVGSGWSIEVDEDESVTQESYFAAIDAWKAKQ